MRVSTLRSWQPTALAEAAAALVAARVAVDDISADAAARLRLLPQVWLGEGGEAARSAARWEADRTDALAEVLGQVRRILLGCCDALTAAQALLENGIAHARSHGLWVSDTGAVSTPPPYAYSSDAPPATVAAARQESEAARDARAAAEAMVRQALAAAEEADRDAAAALRAAFAAGADGTISADERAAVDAVTARDVPAVGSDPRDVAAWWATLSPEQRDRLVDEHPELIGNLDGVPVADRDRANRALLDEAIADAQGDLAALQAQLSALPAPSGRMGPSSPHVQIAAQMAVLRERLAMLEAIDGQLGGSRPPRSLMVLDTQMPGRAAIAIGDVDTADHVAVLVPGLDSFVTNYMGAITTNAATVQRNADFALDAMGRGDESVATVAWIGYTAPDLARVAFDANARAGADLLDSTLWGIEANRAVGGGSVNITGLGHSYGSLVTGLAAARDTAMDNVVLFGSPGVGADHVSELQVPADRVFTGEATWDVVSDLDHFGPDPANPDFGAVPFQTDGGYHSLADGVTAGVTGHSDYYAPGSESLWNITAVVVDERSAVNVGHTSGVGEWLI